MGVVWPAFSHVETECQKGQATSVVNRIMPLNIAISRSQGPVNMSLPVEKGRCSAIRRRVSRCDSSLDYPGGPVPEGRGFLRCDGKGMWLPQTWGGGRRGQEPRNSAPSRSWSRWTQVVPLASPEGLQCCPHADGSPVLGDKAHVPAGPRRHARLPTPTPRARLQSAAAVLPVGGPRNGHAPLLPGLHKRSGGCSQGPRPSPSLPASLPCPLPPSSKRLLSTHQLPGTGDTAVLAAHVATLRLP